MDSSLFDQLRSLGVQLGPKDIKAPVPEPNHRIEDLIDGYFHPTSQGNTFVIPHRYPADHTHGLVQICEPVDISQHRVWAGLDRDQLSGERSKVLYLDTETSGLAGGTGTYVFLVGLGYYTAEGFQVNQVFLKDPSEEPAFLETLSELLAGYDVIVTYNGKTFDVPLLKTRYMLGRQQDPFGSFGHVDLLHLSRRIWKERLERRALSDLEHHILQFQRSVDEVPGWMIPQIYFDYLKSGDARPLEGVIYHNTMDVLSMAALFTLTANLLKEPAQYCSEPEDLYSIARIKYKIHDTGDAGDAIALFETCLAFDLSTGLRRKITMEYATHCKHDRLWPKALELWQSVAQDGYSEAHIELAKYYEHEARDPEMALFWTNHAITMIQQLNIGSVFQSELVELKHRQNRLVGKIDRKRGKDGS